MTDQMRHDDNIHATEEQLRRELEELKRQLASHHSQAGGAPANRWRPSRTTMSALLAVLVVLLIAAFLAGYLPLQRRDAILRAEGDAQQKQLPRVAVIRVARGPVESEITLPGTIPALTAAPILA